MRGDLLAEDQEEAKLLGQMVTQHIQPQSVRVQKWRMVVPGCLQWFLALHDCKDQLRPLAALPSPPVISPGKSHEKQNLPQKGEVSHKAWGQRLSTSDLPAPNAELGERSPCMSSLHPPGATWKGYLPQCPLFPEALTNTK